MISRRASRPFPTVAFFPWFARSKCASRAVRSEEALDVQGRGRPLGRRRTLSPHAQEHECILASRSARPTVFSYPTSPALLLAYQDERPDDLQPAPGRRRRGLLHVRRARGASASPLFPNGLHDDNRYDGRWSSCKRPPSRLTLAPELTVSNIQEQGRAEPCARAPARLPVQPDAHCRSAAARRRALHDTRRDPRDGLGRRAQTCPGRHSQHRRTRLQHAVPARRRRVVLPGGIFRGPRPFAPRSRDPRACRLPGACSSRSPSWCRPS